ncbi:hypothetical protein LAZ67_19002787 [Cordylochernes scorpioides]|uniref:Uncharacterized protein n=1 Tax=Cordylochernes scorpioides TaxID=51811 RepID=A0ABY6LL23_9ARAC|nr:hypothetical protein LAZ67_19002787 [Cordylochernes scorpioides]
MYPEDLVQDLTTSQDGRILAIAAKCNRMVSRRMLVSELDSVSGRKCLFKLCPEGLMPLSSIPSGMDSIIIVAQEDTFELELSASRVDRQRQSSEHLSKTLPEMTKIYSGIYDENGVRTSIPGSCHYWEGLCMEYRGDDVTRYLKGITKKNGVTATFNRFSNLVQHPLLYINSFCDSKYPRRDVCADYPNNPYGYPPGYYPPPQGAYVPPGYPAVAPYCPPPVTTVVMLSCARGVRYKGRDLQKRQYFRADISSRKIIVDILFVFKRRIIADNVRPSSTEAVPADRCFYEGHVDRTENDREKWKQTCENLIPRNPNTKLWNLAKQIDRVQPQTENTNMIKNTDGTPATNDKISANLLAYALENTDLNKTSGADGIHGRMISNLDKIGEERPLNIFNNSWKTGKLPQDCKNATIIPIKKLDKSADDPKNTDLSPSQILLQINGKNYTQTTHLQPRHKKSLTRRIIWI